MATIIPEPGDDVCFINETTGTEYCWDGDKWVASGSIGGGGGGGDIDLPPDLTDALNQEVADRTQGDLDVRTDLKNDYQPQIDAIESGGVGGPDLTDELNQEVQDRKDGDREVRNDLKADYQVQIDQLKQTPPGSMPEPPANQGPHGRETNSYGFSSWVTVLPTTGGELTGGIEVKSTEKKDKVFFNDNFSIHGDGAIYTQPGDIYDEHQVPNLGTVLALIAASNHLNPQDDASDSKTGKIGAGLVYKFMNQGGTPSDGIVHGSSYNLQANSDLYFSFNPNGYDPGKYNIPFFRHENIQTGTKVYEASLINNERYDLTMGIYEPQWEGEKPKATDNEDYNRTKSPANWMGSTDIRSIEFTNYGIKVRTGKKPNIWHGSLTTGRLYRFIIPGFM